MIHLKNNNIVEDNQEIRKLNFQIDSLKAK